MNPAKLLFVILPMVSACVKQVDLVVGDRQVVVDCILSESAQQTLYLSWTNGKTGVSPEALDGAVATLTDLTESRKAGTFVPGSEGAWTLDYAAIPEHGYRLEIEVPGYGIIRAEDTMPPAVDVSYARGHFDRLNVKNPEYFIMKNFYMDPNLIIGPAGGYYKWEEIRSVFYQSASLPVHLLVRGYVYDEQTGKHRLSEMMCTDSPGVLNGNLNGEVYGAKQKDNVLLNPALVGFSCHHRYLRIEKESAIQQEYFTISGDFREGQWGFGIFPEAIDKTLPTFVPMSATDDYLLFTALSDKYNQYIDEAELLWKRNESSLLSDRFIRESPYSNIEGGTGFFGASTSQILPVAQLYTTDYKINTL